MKVSVREKGLIAIAFVFILVILYVNLFLDPLNEEITGIEQDISSKETELFTLKLQTDGISELNNQITSNEQRFNELVAQFPAKWDETMFLRYIDEQLDGLASKNSVTYQGLSERGDYVVGTYVLNVSCKYNNMIMMLERFEYGDYFNTISQLSVSSYSEDDSEISVSFTISFYALEK